MKIEAKMTTLCCFEKIRYWMKSIAKTSLSEYLLHVTVCHPLLDTLSGLIHFLCKQHMYTAMPSCQFSLTENHLLTINMLEK